MSKAGQNTVTGIAVQADIALIYLLEHYQFDNFRELLVESADWEDFALKFEEKVESFEVKWHSRALSHSAIKEIIDKELNKRVHDESYSFKIIAKKFSPDFLKDAEYIKRVLPYIGLISNEIPLEENEIVKKLLKKDWTLEAIAFIRRTEFVALDSNEIIETRLTEYFRYKWHLYLNDEDTKAIISSSFRSVLEKAKTGASITKLEFERTIEAFDKNLAQKSESFTPEIDIGRRTENLDTFLSSTTEFRKLNHPKYLTPLSSLSNQRLVFYMVRKIEKNSFTAKEIDFFLEKVLLKQSHIYTCFRVLEAKWKNGLLDPKYFIDFISRNFDRLPYDHIVNEALKITRDILKSKPDLSQDVLTFLKRKIFPRISGADAVARRDIDYGFKFAHLPEIVDLLGKQLDSEENFIDLLLNVFDFTGDHHQSIVETPSKIYSILKDFIKKDIKNNLPKILKKLEKQFKAAYGGKYNGYELAGSGIGAMGGSFSITDVGVARKLFTPLFHELYLKDKKELFTLLSRWLFKGKKEFSAQVPIYLKRASVPVLLKYLGDDEASAEMKTGAKKYLTNVLAIQKGIPSTSDILFSFLSGADLKAVGQDFVLQLITQDQVKYGQDRLPTNIFVIETLLHLIDAGYDPANDHLLNLLKRPEFKKTREAEQLLRLLGNRSVLEKKWDKRVQLIKAFDLKAYMETGVGGNWINGTFLKNLLEDLWSQSPDQADDLLKDLTSGDAPSEKILNLVASGLFELFKKFPDRIYTIFASELNQPQLFRSRFKKSDHFRGNFCDLAESLISVSRYDDAKKIIDLLIEDPSPNTDAKGDHNYHTKVKNGESSPTISGVRARVSWTIQKLVLQNKEPQMEYAFEKIKLLLDLDGQLARRLGYVERDLYVMGNAMVPLVELAHPYRRNLLNQYRASLGDQVKVAAFDILKFVIDELSQKKSTPNFLTEHLIDIFAWIRDLDTAQANQLLDLLETAESDRSTFLFLFYGLFRKKEFPDIAFEPVQFEERLKKIFGTAHGLREKLAWDVWRTLDSDEVTEAEVDTLDGMVPLFKGHYQPRVFGYVSNCIEDALTSPRRYRKYFDLLRAAMKIEIDELQKKPGSPRVSLRKTAEILRTTNIDDFLTIVNDVLDVSDPNSGQGIYSFNLHALIKEFKNIETVPEGLQTKYNQLNTRLEKIGAFIDE